MKILVVEDEKSIREVLVKYLERAGFTAIEAASGEVALLKFNQGVDLVVLDLNLPNKDGVEVCQEIRRKSTVPIIMATARTGEIDELKGLDIGADDYIKKPFSPKVLVARVESMLRRAQTEPPALAGLVLDEERMAVHKNNQSLELTTTQFKILQRLMEKPGKVYTRAELMEATNSDGKSKSAFDRTIDAHIKTIRKLVEDDPKRPKFLLTVVGSGYKYNHEA